MDDHILPGFCILTAFALFGFFALFLLGCDRDQIFRKIRFLIESLTDLIPDLLQLFFIGHCRIFGKKRFLLHLIRENVLHRRIIDSVLLNGVFQNVGYKILYEGFLILTVSRYIFIIAFF